VFDRVICGAMRRHRETAEAIAEAYRAGGATLPDASFDADLNEFDHRAVVARFLAESPGAALPARDVRPAPQEVMRLLHGALTRWTSGAWDDQLDEGWSAFGVRVNRGAERLRTALAGGERILLVSSGGTLTRIALAALEAPDARAVELNLALRNAALCEFHLVGDALRLGSWNGLPHLADDRSLWTHY
jgi:broad specificity phosphatase PhoE